MIKKISLLSSLILVFSGCTSTPEKQSPAPVYTPEKPAIAKPKPINNDAKVKVIPAPVIIEQQELVIQPKAKAASSNVVVALLLQADNSYQQGDYNESVATLESALRIEPRNALSLYKLAVIRLQQGQAELAENLAKKSALLATGDAALKKKNWLLIAQAREQQNNPQGANAARHKAQQF
ncbi:MAG: tetratricopeptide repeat protein [Methyloprofundus sp.]|nr:tetratricopeptide repeat protein [Methyloprofundus sp.]